jgi:TonB family protein
MQQTALHSPLVMRGMARSVVLSLAAHALILLGLMVCVRRAAGLRATSRDDEVEVLSVPPSAAPNAGAELKAHPQPLTPHPTRLASVAPTMQEKRTASAVVLVGPENPAAPAVPEVATSQPVTGVSSIFDMRGDMRQPSSQAIAAAVLDPNAIGDDLSNAMGTSDTAEAGQDPPGDPSPEEQGIEAKQRIQAYVDDTQGAYRVQAGAIDPYYYDLSRRAQVYFQPTAAELALAPPPIVGGPLFSKDSTDPTVGPMRRYDHAVPVTTDTFAPYLAADGQMLEVQGKTQHAPTMTAQAGLSVWIDGSGNVTRVSVTQSSRVDAIDKAAQDAITRAAAAVPRPASSGNGPVETRWVFGAANGEHGVRSQVTLVAVLPASP